MFITDKCKECDCLDSNANGFYCQVLDGTCVKDEMTNNKEEIHEMILCKDV